MKDGFRYYISGGITHSKNAKEKFERAETYLELNGCKTVNPYKILSSTELEYAEYMKVCMTLVELCDGIYMLQGWQKSQGAKVELAYAKSLGIKVKYELKQWKINRQI